jgi:hypothetical protein
MSDNSLIQKTLSWVNDTFVPLGLKPIEYFLPACPGKATACVIAIALQENSKWSGVTVTSSSIDLGLEGLTWDERTFEIPEDVASFIRKYDDGLFPELVDLDALEHQYQDDHSYRRDMLEKIEAQGIDIGNRYAALKEEK